MLDDLGATLLELVLGDPEQPEEIEGIVIHDPLDDPVLPRRALVLGVGLRTVEDITTLLYELGAHGAAGLVIRAPVVPDDSMRVAVRDSGVAVLALTRGAAWTQLAAMLRELLAEGDVGGVQATTIGGIPSGDLFALANAIASLIDAPVTIEDRSSRVLAFSGRQDEADSPRVETVLGRKVPERYLRILTEQGVFRELYRNVGPVMIEPVKQESGEYSLPRVAVAVRAGDEVLGSIWAALREPLSEERSNALSDAAKLVALHMLRIRAGADVERRLKADLLGTALEGGPGAREALDRLGLGRQPVVVLTLAVAGANDERPIAEEAVRGGDQQRLTDAFAMHLSAVHPRSAAALVGDVAYGLLPVAHDSDDAERRATRLAEEFLDRIGGRVDAMIGIGPVARDVSGLAYSRASADRVLRVLLEMRGSRRVAGLADVQVEALMIELRDTVVARGDRPTGPIARLIDYDEQHSSTMCETLWAWLEAFGDVIAASSALYVHPNTFRYRLRRVSEVGGIDLDDADSRFAAMVQLRIVAPVAASRTGSY